MKKYVISTWIGKDLFPHDVNITWEQLRNPLGKLKNAELKTICCKMKLEPMVLKHETADLIIQWLYAYTRGSL